MKHIWFSIILIIALLSCKKNDDFGPQCIECPRVEIPESSSSPKLFIVNEGVFTWNNASLSVLNLDSNSIQNQVFQTANNSLLGDVAMSIEIIDSLGYVTVDNSSVIQVVDLQTFELKDQVTSVLSPRFIKQVTPNKAYVTSIYANELFILDLATNLVTGTILTGGWNEELLIHGQYAYVINRDLDKLQVVDISTDQIIETLDVGVSPNSIEIDANENLWILCDGGFEEDTASLYKFEINDLSNPKVFNFSTLQESPEDLAINGEGTILYYLNQGVYELPVSATSLPNTLIIPDNNRTLYGLGIAPDNNQIFVSDAKDYIQQGEIYQYSAQGTYIERYTVGLNPSSFTFYYP